MNALTNANVDAIESGDVCLLFTATWCGPCRMIKPTFTKQASENKDKVTAYSVDVDSMPQLASRFSVRSVPAAVVLRDGEVKEVLHGAGGVNMANVLKALA